MLSSSTISRGKKHTIMRKIIVFALVASMGLFGQNVNAQDDPISISRELKDVKSQLEYLERKRQILIVILRIKQVLLIIKLNW